MSEQIGTDRTALDSEIAGVSQAQADEAAREQKSIDALNGQIKSLTDTIAALQAHPAAEDFTTEIASLESLKSALTAQLPDTTSNAPVSGSGQ